MMGGALEGDQATSDSNQTGFASDREEKYAYMAANGGISQWFFLPYVSCGKQIELNRLQQLEQAII